MDPRVKRTITKLEQQKEKKTNEKKRIEQELSERVSIMSSKH